MTEQPTFAVRVARAFLFSGAGHLLSRAVFIVSLLVVLRWIAPDEFGVASIVLTICAWGFERDTIRAVLAGRQAGES